MRDRDWERPIPIHLDPAVFPRVIDRLAAQLGRSRSAVARRAAISPEGLHNWSKAARPIGFPSAGTLYRIAVALDTTVEVLLTGDDTSEDAGDRALWESIQDRPQLRTLVERIVGLSDEEIGLLQLTLDTTMVLVQSQRFEPNLSSHAEMRNQLRLFRG